MALNKFNNNKNSNNNKKKYTGFISIVVWALILTLLANHFMAGMKEQGTVTVKYSDFLVAVDTNAVDLVNMSSGEFAFYLKDGWTMTEDGDLTYQKPEENKEPAQTEITSPLFSMPADERIIYKCAPWSDANLVSVMAAKNSNEDPSDDITFGPDLIPETSFIVELLVSYVLPMVLMITVLMLLYRFMFSKMGGGGMGGIGGVGKSNAKVYVEKKTGVTFRDVAGQDEAKESLQEIIDMLHNPAKYTEIGAKLPKGALLVGSPGTGKTLLAKAVAGEAGVPFFSISGSDFVEMFVGVGASRVRDLFKEAAKMAPCIIFIDEIDTIGKSRDASKFGGNDEREQTLNQLLAELDGFDPTKGVIVLAATNRPEVLDKALLRPGRFDRRITVDRPNLAGRLATLQVHTRNIRLAEDVNLNKIAQATAGCVGADLANLVNEAALRAVRFGRKAVNQNDLLTAFETVIAGAEKKGTVLTEKEKRMIAYHEVGHALVASKQKDNSMPVSKITIVPHTQGALGYTLHLPEEEKFLMTEEDLLAEIRTLLAGRSAEEVVFNSKSSGAANDIERATEIARKMVAMFGMSEKYGMMGLATVRSQYLDGGYGMDCAQDTFAGVDGEVRAIIDRCHADAIQILEENREMLDKIAAYLLEKETITGQEMMCIIEGKDPALADNFGADAAERRKAALRSDVEPPARSVRMTSEPVVAPPLEEQSEEPKPEDSAADTEKSE